MLGSTDVLMM